MDFSRHGVKVPHTESEAQAVRAARSVLIRGAQAIGESFTDPGDDWAPVWLVLTPTQGTMITADGETANHPRAKEKATRYVGDFARRVGAVAVGSLMSTWQVALDADEARAREVERQVRAQDGSTEGIPERFEALLLVTYTASTVEAQTALIERHEAAPPTLREFKRMPEGSWSGRMASPLQQALRRVG
jgi:hypothetical protein